MQQTFLSEELYTTVEKLGYIIMHEMTIFHAYHGENKLYFDDVRFAI